MTISSNSKVWQKADAARGPAIRPASRFAVIRRLWHMFYLRGQGKSSVAGRKPSRPHAITLTTLVADASVRPEPYRSTLPCFLDDLLESFEVGNLGALAFPAHAIVQTVQEPYRLRETKWMVCLGPRIFPVLSRLRRARRCALGHSHPARMARDVSAWRKDIQRKGGLPDKSRHQTPRV